MSSQDVAADQAKPAARRRGPVRRFFRPAQGSRVWRRLLPWVTVAAIVIGLLVGGAHAWAWTNSSAFCGTTCHTMPPQYVEYQLSPHSRVSCVECHIGRDFIGKQLPRKAAHAQLIFRMAFGLYDYPIYAKGMRPARDACETCHAPDKFSDDSVKVIQHYRDDEANTPYSLSLVMKIGGGTQRDGLGRGIHWHVENKVQFLSTDSLDQKIPYVRVTNADGSVQEYLDAGSGIQPQAIDPNSLKTMDCITCHNRVSHRVAQPADSVESSMARGAISSDIPYIRSEAVKALTVVYADQDAAFAGIALTLDTYYMTSHPDFYATGKDKLQAAVAEIQRIYSLSVFKDQALDWRTHPDNLGHAAFPGCFRCHDGKHLDTATQPIRLDCNLCHSVPVVTGTEASGAGGGQEPASHRNGDWIGLHDQAYDQTCADCHTTADAGGTSDISFCSNSACHGRTYPYATFATMAR